VGDASAVEGPLRALELGPVEVFPAPVPAEPSGGATD